MNWKKNRIHERDLRDEGKNGSMRDPWCTPINKNVIIVDRDSVIILFQIECTVKPVLSGHSYRQNKGLKDKW